MLKQCRQHIVKNLWHVYRDNSIQMKQIAAGLAKKGAHDFALDHFAVIDLPGPHTGIPMLSQIFSTLGYVERGKDYLADKQNDFLWMTEEDSFQSAPPDVLPQVVVADFRPEAMPVNIRTIIDKYAAQARALPLASVQALVKRVTMGDPTASALLTRTVCDYFSGRDWPLPTTQEFYTVHEFNELLAWVLVFGRRPNHFTVSVHLLDQFADLHEFHQFVARELNLTLNQDGGIIKGGAAAGIAQGSTTGIVQRIALADGEVDIPTGFVEFVWRYPVDAMRKPTLWKDYFTGFIAQHADRVIESLYV